MKNKTIFTNRGLVVLGLITLASLLLSSCSSSTLTTCSEKSGLQKEECLEEVGRHQEMLVDRRTDRSIGLFR